MYYLFRCGAALAAALLAHALPAQTCGDETDVNDVAKFQSYGPVTSGVLADPDGACGDAIYSKNA